MKRWMRLGVSAAAAAMVVTSVAGEVDARARGDIETYASPTFGVTVEYDESVWSVFQETEADDQNPGDILGLETPSVRGGLIIDVHDKETDADDCLEEAVDFGLEDTEDAELIEDEDGEPIEGSSRGSAYAAYNFLSDGTYFGSYFGCVEFGDELGVVVFMLYTDSRDFDDAYELIEPIIDSVDDSDAHERDQDDRDREDDEDEDDRDREDDEDDDRDEEDVDDRDRDEEDDEGEERAGTGVYESELYGYTLTYNAENWTPDGSRVDETSESFNLSGPEDEVVTVITVRAEGAPASAYTSYYVETLTEQFDAEYELYEHPTTGETIQKQNRNEAYALYTFEEGSTQFLVYTHAVTSEDGQFVVLVGSIAVVASYDLLEEDVFSLLDQIEY